MVSSHGYVKTNAGGEALDGALPKQRNSKTHFRALPYQELSASLGVVESSTASQSVKLAVLFVALTAARSNEVRGARWSEIDLECKEWRIPVQRMKAGQQHTVPLSAEAVRVLEQAKVLDDGSGLVFPSRHRRGKELSDNALSKTFRDNGLSARASVHGMRSSFRDWCAENGVPREVAEAALAHTVPGVEGAYLRTKQVEQRRPVMQKWGAFVSGSATVSNGWGFEGKARAMGQALRLSQAG